jgi:hypothetical protein
MVNMRRPFLLDITPPPVEHKNTTSFHIILEVVKESIRNFEADLAPATLELTEVSEKKSLA